MFIYPDLNQLLKNTSYKLLQINMGNIICDPKLSSTSNVMEYKPAGSCDREPAGSCNR